MAHNIFKNFKERNVAITDGVFAIAMTILVFPSILIYFLSFYIVYNFWENTVFLLNFKKVSNNVFSLNIITMAAVCLIPFATGFLFQFYNYVNVNLFFSLLIMVISLLYILMFFLLVRDNYSEHFKKKVL
ncbi:TMEM175 family protein [uncultured Methanobrevibacter sp.]|uniref:TMEM175 family protein n=1 Tax=uncultured Methanobrevibacter sp. TaxID=253161 RepID=UPI0025CCCED8|nr:TMEM175 family protein [uncultured Methanobrevibacter sp.]